MKLLVLSPRVDRYEPLVAPICHDEGIDLFCFSDTSTLPCDVVPVVSLLLAAPHLAAPLLPQMTSLRWMESTWAGVDELVRDERIRERAGEVSFTRQVGIHGDIIAEYVLGYLIAFHRSFFAHRVDQAHAVWKHRRYDRLSSKTVGIVGTGAIGQWIARRCRSLDMRVIGFSRSGAPAECFEKVYCGDGRDEFLSQSNAVVAILPLTDDTAGLVDETWFAAMRPDCLFVNVGRGKTVDQEALVGALQVGSIGGAVLDVFEEEPLPAVSPLWGMENVVITPHCAGITFAEDIVSAWRANLTRYLRREPLAGLVDFERGY